MRAGASLTSKRAMPSSTIPAPALMVSARCLSMESPGATAAAIPPCAQAEEAPCPIGAAAITVTGRGASFSAQNSPAKPPPTMTTSSDTSGSAALPRSSIASLRAVLAAASAFQVDHALDGQPRACGDHRIDHHGFPELNQAIEDLRQRDPAHVRTEVARPHQLDVRWDLGRDIG